MNCSRTISNSFSSCPCPPRCASCSNTHCSNTSFEFSLKRNLARRRAGVVGSDEGVRAVGHGCVHGVAGTHGDGVKGSIKIGARSSSSESSKQVGVTRRIGNGGDYGMNGGSAGGGISSVGLNEEGRVGIES